jgi:hypothetical protein
MLNTDKIRGEGGIWSTLATTRVYAAEQHRILINNAIMESLNES